MRQVFVLGQLRSLGGEATKLRHLWGRLVDTGNSEDNEAIAVLACGRLLTAWLSSGFQAVFSRSMVRHALVRRPDPRS